jgi:L-ascorbate metabolism protein UlaG (beta-lactamase superfamily)
LNQGAILGINRLFLSLLVGVALSYSCARSFVHHGPAALAVRESQTPPALYVQWLGVSSWIISYGDDVVVVDPFFSRPSFLSVALSLVLPSLFDDFGYNVERTNDVLPDLPENTRFVLLGHAHYDHLMDVPYYMKRKSGQNVTYVGSRTARNILSGFKPAGLDFRIAEEQPKIEKDRVRITAFPSDHAPHFSGHKFMSGKVKEPMPSFPRHSGDYLEGRTFIYFIDFLDGNKQVLWRVFVNGAASSPRGAKALQADTTFRMEHAVDIAILCVPGWDKVDHYPNSILQLINPDMVILSHYDDFGSPYKHGEDPTIPGEIKFVPFANYGGFLTRLNELKTKHNYHYDIYQPKTGQCIRFPVSNPVASCER